MSTTVVTGILKAIPWKSLIQHGPALLDTAKSLFKNSKVQNTAVSPDERILQLERNEKAQARLVEQLVERQELLITTVQVINLRLKVLFVCTAVTGTGLAACIALLLAR